MRWDEGCESGRHSSEQRYTVAEQDEWMTVREAAAVMGIRVGRIYSMIKGRKVSAELMSVGKGARLLVVRPREVRELMSNSVI